MVNTSVSGLVHGSGGVLEHHGMGLVKVAAVDRQIGREGGNLKPYVYVCMYIYAYVSNCMYVCAFSASHSVVHVCASNICMAKHHRDHLSRRLYKKEMVSTYIHTVHTVHTVCGCRERRLHDRGVPAVGHP